MRKGGSEPQSQREYKDTIWPIGVLKDNKLEWNLEGLALESERIRFESRDAELVLGLVCAVGTNYQKAKDALVDALRQFRYEAVTIRLSDHLAMLADVDGASEYERVDRLMTAGDEIRRQTGHDDIVALAALAKINRDRGSGGDGHSRMPLLRRAHILLTLKNPKEVETLRRIYGSGFWLMGVYAPEDRRVQYLQGVRGMSEGEARKLIARDEEEKESYGQKTRKTFQLADVFVDEENHEEEIRRFLDLVFGHPYLTPTKDEHAMFLACGAGMRSGQLGRQVGAAIVSREGDVLATGCNDVPKPGGGLYWPGPGDSRDHVLGYDSNERSRSRMIDEIVKKLGLEAKPPATLDEEDWAALFRKTSLWEITEYGRAVHAEMDALLTCARIGVSPLGSTLFTTTFPCHNCARHIIAAGVSRVVYIEPYPKSKAKELHFDSIVLNGEARAEKPDNAVMFEPFIGVGPRRYIQLFSVDLGEGESIERKEDGLTVDWRREEARLRVQMSPRSYLQQEQIAVRLFDESMKPEEKMS